MRTRPKDPAAAPEKNSSFYAIRPADIILIVSVAVFSVLLLVLFIHQDLQIRQPMLEVSLEGERIGTYSLAEDREFRIGGDEHYNTVRIENGSVRITEADCPDGSCVRSLPLDGRGGTIICLPHRLVLRIIDGTGGLPDAVAE